MKIRFIIGGSGSGKSTALHNEIVSRASKEPGRQFMVIVPDQFTMQTQKEIVEEHPDHGIMNIDVQSFGRLCHRIADEVGEKERIVLDDTGKNLVIKHLASEIADELPAIGSCLSRKGYVHEVKSVISEFMQYGYGAPEVGRLAEHAAEKKALSAKLKDLKRIYEAFTEYLGERYITKEEKLDILASQIEKSALLKGSVVAFDGFTGFTPVQENVILKLMEVCDELIFTVIMPPEELEGYRGDFDDHRLFALSMKTMRSIEQLAADAKAQRGEDILLGSPAPRFAASPALAFLDRHIFRSDDCVYKEELNGQIELFAAANPQEETEEIFRRIRTLTRSGGYAYRDIAVITGDLEKYGPYVQEASLKYEIPCFVDLNHKLDHNPFTEFLRSAMECIDRGYTPECVMHFLRSGLSGIDHDAADELDNYLTATGIRGAKAWSRAFTRRPSYMKDDDEALLRINDTRQLIWDKTGRIRRCGSKARADEYAKALYEFITESEAYERLCEYSDYFKEISDQEREKEYDQVYEAVCRLLEQTASLLEGEEISLKDFIDIFLSGIEEVKLGVIPMDVDRIVAGDMERTRLKPVKVVFFAGLNDGIIPASSAGGGMISDIDREFLESSGFVLAPTPRQRMFIQRLYLYHALGRPSDKLVLSYSAADNKGDPLRPSYLVSRIKEIFPKLTAVRAGRADDELPAMGELALMLSEYASGAMSEEKKRVFFTDYALMKERDGKRVRELTEAAFFRYIPKVLSKASVRNLYGDMISGSVSRMESFAACAYTHFLSYGLRLKERESNELLSPDMGNIYHEVLERFGKALDDRKMQWADISIKDVDEILPKILEDVAAEYDTQKLYQDAQSAYIYKRMGRILRRSIMTVAYQLSKGSFKPVAYERRFERMIKTGNGETAVLKGKIDRLDEYRAEDKIYIKVTDYKSSARSLKYDKVLSGEQLQLPLYLYEAVKNAGEGAVPAALFYYILKEPLIEADSIKDGDPDDKIRKELKPKGLISSDMNVINALDGDFSGWSDVMPVYLTKEGKLSGSSRCALPPEDMKALTDYSYYKLKDLTKEMLKGRIDISPSDEESCRYCDHKDECMFDTGLQGCTYKGRKHSEEEALELIKEAVKDKDLEE